MPDEVLDAPAAPAEPTEPVESKETSLDEHASLYGPPDPTLEGEAKKANDEARAKVRHRAKSQQASPEDAPRIAELTRKLRETEAERDRLKQPAQARSAVAEQPLGSVVPPTTEAGAARQGVPPPQTREKPSVDRIGVEGGYDTYEAYVEDLADWKAEQREIARETKRQQDDAARQQSEAQQHWARLNATYGERLAAFKATHTDYDALIEQHGKVPLPDPALAAIVSSEHGPAWSYHLMSHPDQLTELALLFDGRPFTDATIAHATRWLASRAKVETAASPAASKLTLAPTPPNPVKTGAAKTDTEGPGDDSMSIEAHEKAYGRGRRR